MNSLQIQHLIWDEFEMNQFAKNLLVKSTESMHLLKLFLYVKNSDSVKELIYKILRVHLPMVKLTRINFE